MKQRIHFIDTIRGFAMILVVYYHVLIHTFGKEFSTWDIFVTLRMPLFFFLSGFLTYKTNRFKNVIALNDFLINKTKVLLFPTLVFSLIFTFLMAIPYHFLVLDRFKGGYWFTYTLFFYFVIYAIGDFLISPLAKGNLKVIVGATISVIIFAVAKYSVVPSCPWFNSAISNAIGIPNFQFFIFFFFGAFARAYFKFAKKILESEKFGTLIIFGFIFLLLILHIPFSKDWFFNHGAHPIYTLLQTLAGFVGIAAIFIFFRKNETTIANSHIGKLLQHIGTRTLDIYLIHSLIVFTDMHFVGAFLTIHFSFIIELVLGSIVTCTVTVLCLLISQFIRCSDTLAKLFFGKVIKES